MADTATTHSLESADDSPDYRTVEPLAIIAALLGITAPLVLFNSLLCVLPIIGGATAVIALTRIARDPARTGRAAALAGLALATFFLALALARYGSEQWLLGRQSRPVADQFMESLRARSPEQAVLLQAAPDDRPPVDDGLWSFIRNDVEMRQKLEKLVARPEIRMLLALGDKADVRFYKTNAASAGKAIALVDNWYTVTFTDTDDKKKTILFGVFLERRPVMNSELNPWRVRDFTTQFDTADTAT